MRKNVDDLENNNLLGDDFSVSSGTMKCDSKTSDHVFITSTSPNVSSNYHRKQQSKPINFTRKRTNSEIQLYEDLLVAEYRDYCMYHRIHGHVVPNVSGICRTVRGLDLSLDGTFHQNRREIEHTNVESVSNTTMQCHIDQDFACQTLKYDTWLSMTLPKSVMSLDSIPISKRMDDEIDGVFDMEI
jgi:hypothetical protein